MINTVNLPLQISKNAPQGWQLTKDMAGQSVNAESPSPATRDGVFHVIEVGALKIAFWRGLRLLESRIFHIINIKQFIPINAKTLRWTHHEWDAMHYALDTRHWILDIGHHGLCKCALDTGQSEHGRRQTAFTAPKTNQMPYNVYKVYKDCTKVSSCGSVGLIGISKDTNGSKAKK